MPHARTSVVIAGGGPFGLMLANELGRRGVATLLVDPKPGTAYAPQANATQARTMEHYRRLGFADEVRALGLPPDFPTDIAYYTRFAKYELARFRLPSARQAKASVARTVIVLVVSFETRVGAEAAVSISPVCSSVRALNVRPHTPTVAPSSGPSAGCRRCCPGSGRRSPAWKARSPGIRSRCFGPIAPVRAPSLR